MSTNYSTHETSQIEIFQTGFYTEQLWTEHITKALAIELRKQIQGLACVVHESRKKVWGKCLYTIAAWGHHAGARRHGGGREGSSFPIPVMSVPSRAFVRASLIYLLRHYLMGYWCAFHKIQTIQTRKEA